MFKQCNNKIKYNSSTKIYSSKIFQSKAESNNIQPQSQPFTPLGEMQTPENASWIKDGSRHPSESDQTYKNCKGVRSIVDDVQVWQ